MNFSHVVIVTGVMGTKKSAIGALQADGVRVSHAEGEGFRSAA